MAERLAKIFRAQSKLKIAVRGFSLEVVSRVVQVRVETLSEKVTIWTLDHTVNNAKAKKIEEVNVC